MMSPVEAFFLGALPGIALVLVNMFSSWKRTRRVRAMAIAEGQDWDLNLDPIRRLKILKDNSLFFVEGESDALREEKNSILSDWPKFMLKHFIGAVLLISGGFIGAFSTLFFK